MNGSCRGLQQRIPFLPIVEICCCVLGRGDAVGAGRELPALVGSQAFVAAWRAASRY